MRERLKRGSKNLGELVEKTREARDKREAKQYEKNQEKLKRLNLRHKIVSTEARIRRREAEITRIQSSGRDMDLFGSEPSAIDPMLFDLGPQKKKKRKKTTRKKKKDDDFWRL